MSKHVIIIGVLLVLVLIMVILLLAFPNMLGRKKFISKEHGYSMIINTGVIEYKRILLDANSKVTMDRFNIKKSDGNCYLSVTRVAEDTNLEEALEAFESDGSYTFNREENVTYGEENYPVKRISYTDNEGAEPLQVEYYYDEPHRIIISVCTNNEHRGAIEKMLKTIKIVPREQ